MQRIKTLTELKQHILLLELEKINCELGVVQELENTCEKLSPVNLVKRQFARWTGNAEFTKILVQAGTSVLAGYVAKKLAETDESHPMKKFFSAFLQPESKPANTTQKE